MELFSRYRAPHHTAGIVWKSLRWLKGHQRPFLSCVRNEYCFKLSFQTFWTLISHFVWLKIFFLSLQSDFFVVVFYRSQISCQCFPIINLDTWQSIKEKKDQLYGILFNHKNEWNNAIFSMANGSRDYHTKLSQAEKDKYCMIWHSLYDMWMIQMDYLQNRNKQQQQKKQKQTHRHRK